MSSTSQLTVVVQKLILKNIYARSFASIDAPPGVSEWDLTGLTPVPSDLMKAPRVGESAFAMECTMEIAHDVCHSCVIWALCHISNL